MKNKELGFFLKYEKFCDNIDWLYLLKVVRLRVWQEVDRMKKEFIFTGKVAGLANLD